MGCCTLPARLPRLPCPRELPRKLLLLRSRAAVPPLFVCRLCLPARFARAPWGLLLYVRGFGCCRTRLRLRLVRAAARRQLPLSHSGRGWGWGLSRCFCRLAAAVLPLQKGSLGTSPCSRAFRLQYYIFNIAAVRVKHENPRQFFSNHNIIINKSINLFEL